MLRNGDIGLLYFTPRKALGDRSSDVGVKTDGPRKHENVARSLCSVDRIVRQLK